MRGRYYKYKGELARKIIDDYKSGMLVKDLVSKYNISFGGLYGLIRREANGSKKND